MRMRAWSDKESHYRTRVRAAVQARGLASFMNATRWHALQQAVYDELPFPPPFAVKYVLDDAQSPVVFDQDVWYHGDWHEGLSALYDVEWIRIRPRYLRHRGQLVAPEVVSCAAELRAVLVRLNIPYHDDGDVITVYGYGAGPVV